MNRYEPIEPHSLIAETNGTFVKFSDLEFALTDLKAELRAEYGGNGEFAPVYSTLRMVGERLGIVV